VQCIVSTHAIAVKSLTVVGASSIVHEAPPFVVPMMLGEFGPEAELLTDWHAEMLEHETAVRRPTPVGIGSIAQLDPPFTVPINSGLPKMPNPTAVQLEVEAQDMPLSPFTWGGRL
jgi:hypothetical protein